MLVTYFTSRTLPASCLATSTTQLVVTRPPTHQPTNQVVIETSTISNVEQSAAEWRRSQDRKHGPTPAVHTSDGARTYPRTHPRATTTIHALRAAAGSSTVKHNSARSSHSTKPKRQLPKTSAKLSNCPQRAPPNYSGLVRSSFPVATSIRSTTNPCRRVRPPPPNHHPTSHHRYHDRCPLPHATILPTNPNQRPARAMSNLDTENPNPTYRRRS